MAKSEQYFFDLLDIRILEELQKNSKIKLRTLSKKLRTPISTLHSRIKKMEKAGIIKNYSVIVDWKKLGYAIEAYVLVFVDTTKLKTLNKTQKDIKEFFEKFPFVESVSIITGDADLIVKLRAKDPAELGLILTKKLQAAEGVVKTKTMITIG